MTWTRLHTPARLAAMCLLATTGACSGDSGRDGNGGQCAGLLPGDLVITELMANPSGDDEGKEWFEIYNATSEELDLSGVVIRFRKTDGSGEKLHQIQDAVIAPGGYLVLGDTDPEALPAHVGYGYGQDLGTGFNNAAGEIAIGCGETVLDAVVYEEVSEDISRAFDGTRTPDSVGNDDLGAWCDSVSEYEPEVFGTPGAPNDPCFSEAPTVCLEGGVERSVVAPAPGDLIITEYMPNPAAAADDDGEWFEVYVATDVDLNGLSITKLGDDEPSDVVGSTTCLRATAGSYLVFAHSSDTSLNGGLPRVDYEFGLALSNTSENGTGFSIGWGGQLLDTITWFASGTGASSQLDPKYLDPTRNDEEGAFCLSEEPYGDGDLGSPGEANRPCPIDAPEGSCVDANGELREVLAPSVGDLWITEFMADPSTVGDPEGEWFEVYANAAFDLNALELGRAEEIEEAVDLDGCAPVEAGQYILFAKNADPTTNGGLPAADYEFGLSLLNSNGALYIATGGTVLDAITWSSTEAGASRALDPSVSGPDANDDEGNWCDGADAFGAGDFGTPGEENSACGGTPVGTCDDGGTIRNTVAPGAGDLVITEWMPDPSAVGDTAGEWFEVLVNANVDLNGLQLGNDPEDPDTTLPSSGECLAVTAGTRVVFARNADAMLNGGIMNAIAAGFSLTNSAGSLFVGHGGDVIDEISYSSASAGSSTSVSPGSENAVDNDDEGNHCTSNTPYGDGDNGTPGAANACG